MEENKKYSQFLKVKTRREETRVSMFFQPEKRKPKSCGPVTINGKRHKVNYETGECRLYDFEEILDSKKNSIARTKQMLSDLLDMNDFDWFCALTFDENRINRLDDECVYHAYEKYVNNLEHKFPTLRYVTVMERHKSDNAIHFHMLIGGVPWQKLGLVNSGKVCCHWATKKEGICSKEYFERTKYMYTLEGTDGQPVYNITSFIWGFTTASRIVSRERCNSYLLKYLEKDIGCADIFKKRFFYSRNLKVPEVVTRCIGAGFDAPQNSLILARENILFQHADQVGYDESYNLAMARISNEKVKNIERGLFPSEESTPFD